MKKQVRLLVVVAAAASLAACGSGGSSSTLPTTSSGPPPVHPTASPSAGPTATSSPTSSPSQTPAPTPTPAIAAPSVAQWSSGSAYGTSSIDVTLPSQPATGDLLIVALWNNGQADGSDNTYTAPAGWTQVDTGLSGSYATYEVFSHQVTAGEASGYAFTPLSADREQLWIAIDAAGSSGVDKAANAFYPNATTFTTPSITPSHANDLALAFNLPITSGVPTWTNPGDWSLVAGPTSPWPGEALSQAEGIAAAISDTATLSGSAPGFAGIVALLPKGS